MRQNIYIEYNEDGKYIQSCIGEDKLFSTLIPDTNEFGGFVTDHLGNYAGGMEWSFEEFRKNRKKVHFIGSGYESKASIVVIARTDRDAQAFAREVYMDTVHGLPSEETEVAKCL